MNTRLMNTRHLATAIIASLIATSAFAQSPADLLQKGIYAQETAGDLDGAIQIYRQVAASAGAPKSIAAQAQYQLVLCMLQKGDRVAASRELDLLDAFAERCLRAAERTRLIRDLAAREEQVRSLAAHLLQAEEEELRRLSRELHDEAGQSMLFLRLHLEMLEKSAPPDLRHRDLGFRCASSAWPERSDTTRR